MHALLHFVPEIRTYVIARVSRHVRHRDGEAHALLQLCAGGCSGGRGVDRLQLVVRHRLGTYHPVAAVDVVDLLCQVVYLCRRSLCRGNLWGDVVQFRVHFVITSIQ